MTKLDLAWMTGENRKYLIRDELGMLVPAEDAPDYIKESYAHYCKQKKAVLQREKETGAKII